MTEKEFWKSRSELNERCEGHLTKKGKVYTTNEDRLSNFKSIAQDAGITPLQVWQIYFSKHLFAIKSYIKGGDEGPEGIESNIEDLRNYVDLFYALVYEEDQLGNQLPYTLDHSSGKVLDDACEQPFSQQGLI